MNGETTDSVGTKGGRGGTDSRFTTSRTTGVHDRLRTISCSGCEAKGVLDEFDDEQVIACPSCEDILFRSIYCSTGSA